MKTYSRAWRKLYENDIEDYETILSRDPFETWERNRNPESGAEDALWFASEILYGGDEAQAAQRFLNQCIAISNRAIEENKLTSRLCVGSYPKNRARILRARSYSLGLLQSELDHSSLLQASSDFETWVRVTRKRKLDAIDEAHYLAAIRLALICNDLVQSHRLLNHRDGLQWHTEEYELLNLVAATNADRERAYHCDTLVCFDRYFDKVRNPHFVADIFTETQVLRLELGILRCVHFTSVDGTISWPTVIESIAQ